MELERQGLKCDQCGKESWINTKPVLWGGVHSVRPIDRFYTRDGKHYCSAECVVEAEKEGGW